MQFDDETIYRLFGTEAAEDEDPERLKAYFYKNKSYANISSDLPLRILVGHKGIGKSALLKMAFLEDQDNNVLCVWLQPNDVHLALDSSFSFIRRIEEMKSHICRIVLRKAVERFGFQLKQGLLEKARLSAATVIGALGESLNKKLPELTSEDTLAMARNFLRSSKIRIFIDDVDRGWKAGKEDITNISVLINACRDLSNEDRRMHFRIGLRTDAYFLVRTSDESTDKIEGNVVRLEWDNHDILVVAAIRVANYFGRQLDSKELSRQRQADIANNLSTVITDRFHSKGHWENAPIHRVLLSLVRRRPRDMIKLLSGAAKEAFRNNNQIITTHDLEETFPNYSNERIQDLVLEFRSEMPEIDKLLYNMRPTKHEMQKKAKKSVYSNDQLVTKIRNIMRGFNFSFTNGAPCTPTSIAEFLFKIDFIIARKDRDDGSVDRKYFDQNRMLQSQFVDFGYAWEIHPAYRWALQPQSTATVMQEIDALTD